MGITYNKQFTSKKDRRILTSGPADRQRKQAVSTSGSLDSSLVDDLRDQIKHLQLQLDSKASVNIPGLYTAEQVDAEIIKAIKLETSNLQDEIAGLKTAVKELSGKNKYLESAHIKEIESLKEIIKSKDVLIEQLKNNKPIIDENKLAELISNATKNIVSSSGSIDTFDGPERPKMETTFIDPLSGKDDKMEKHFNIEDVSLDKKEMINSKVNKLKSLMGKLPNKL